MSSLDDWKGKGYGKVRSSDGPRLFFWLLGARCSVLGTRYSVLGARALGLDRQPCQPSKADDRVLDHPRGHPELHRVGQKLQMSLPLGGTKPPVENSRGGRRVPVPGLEAQRPPGAGKPVPVRHQHQALQLGQFM